MSAGYHQPVLLKETIDALAIKSDGTYVDVTFGGGGHSREILKKLGPQGRLFGFDQDPDAWANAPEDARFTLIDQNFGHLANWLRVDRVRAIDGLLGDLGVSSHQFDSSTRGFSIRYDAPLDMRMDQSRSLTAAHIINSYALEELTEVLRQYGELRNAWPVAKAIVKLRPLHSSGELMQATQPLAPRGAEHKFNAQIFQALRIEVNEELSVLKDMLQQGAQLLKPGGRMVIISYHSLEDRLVKDFFRTGNFEGRPQKDFYGHLSRPLEPVHTKPIVPGEEEINLNSRARSAKMRTAEKAIEENK
jgi:16S rRNA (cytosine1402-N4)-methyltransferase